MFFTFYFLFLTSNSCWVYLYLVVTRFLTILNLWSRGDVFVIMIFRLSSGCVSYKEIESEKSTSLLLLSIYKSLAKKTNENKKNIFRNKENSKHSLHSFTLEFNKLLISHNQTFPQCFKTFEGSKWFPY